MTAVVALLGVAALIAHVWIIILAFKESVLWGIGVLFIPGLQIIFALSHWVITKVPLVLYIVSVGALAYVILTNPGDLIPPVEWREARDDAKPVADAVAQYVWDQKGQVPRTVHDLVRAGYLAPEDATDPWGTPWQIGDGVVWTKGIDLVSGTPAADADNFSFDWPDT